MKLFRLLLPLFALVVTGGCVNDDLADCPPSANVTLHFSYLGDGNYELFPTKINKVDLFLFDEGGVFLQSVHLSDTDLAAFCGAKLLLPPGSYRVVGWGNAHENCKYTQLTPGVSTINSTSLESSAPSKGVNATSDSLYYAPRLGSGDSFIITVPETKEKQEETIYFRSAHINVLVYTRGFDETTLTGEMVSPDIELTGLPEKYNFSMTTFGSGAEFRNSSQAVLFSGNSYSFAGFRTFRFGNNNPVRLKVISPSTNTAWADISLKDFMEENKINIDNKDQTTITILLEYKNAKVEISLPGWEEYPVSPGFGF